MFKVKIVALVLLGLGIQSIYAVEDPEFEDLKTRYRALITNPGTSQQEISAFFQKMSFELLDQEQLKEAKDMIRQVLDLPATHQLLKQGNLAPKQQQTLNRTLLNFIQEVASSGIAGGGLALLLYGNDSNALYYGFLEGLVQGAITSSYNLLQSQIYPFYDSKHLVPILNSKFAGRALTEKIATSLEWRPEGGLYAPQNLGGAMVVSADTMLGTKAIMDVVLEKVVNPAVEKRGGWASILTDAYNSTKNVLKKAKDTVIDLLHALPDPEQRILY